METAKIGMQTLEAREGGQCVGDSAQVALTHGHQVEHVPVFRDLGQQRGSSLESRGELPLLDEPTDTPDLGLDARLRGSRLRGRFQRLGRNPGYLFSWNL